MIFLAIIVIAGINSAFAVDGDTSSGTTITSNSSSDTFGCSMAITSQSTCSTSTKDQVTSSIIIEPSEGQNKLNNQDKVISNTDDLNLSNSSVTTLESGRIMAVGSVSTKSFSITEIKDAASRVRAYIESYYKLPNYVQIGSIQIGIPQFLELLTTSLLQINTENNNPIPLRTVNDPTSPMDNINSGNIFKAEYLKIASDVKNYMDSTGKTPDYAYGTSLGTRLGFQNLVYMYSMILDYYNISGRMADFAVMKPWSVISSRSISITPGGATFTVSQIEDAASTVRAYVETSHKLPTSVTINGISIGMPQLLELLTTTLLQINIGNTNPIPERTINSPISPMENIHAGNIFKAEYLKIAIDVKNYMDSTGKTPDYAYGTSLGTYLRFENLVYMYSMILDYHNTSGKIADYAVMKPWSVIISKPDVDPNAPKFSTSQIEDAASTVKTYIASYYKLPRYVTINNVNVTMSQFLELLTTATIQINNGNSNSLALKNYSDPISPMENIHAGNIFKAEYLKIAIDVKNYMDSTGKTPDYAYGTSLGTYLRFENLVYMYSMILDYHNTSGKIADYAVMKPWSVINPFRPIYITSDNIINTTKDLERINSIIDGLKTLGLTAINWGLGPNTHYTVLQCSSVPANALVVDIYGGACAGTIYEMGSSYYKKLVASREVFCVWIPPATDITGLAWLPRSHDDNFSPSSFTGLAHPDQYLLSNGYQYIYSGDLNAIIASIYKQATTA